MAFTPDAPKGFTPDAPKDPIDAANQAASSQEHGPVQDVIDMLRAVPDHLVPALKGMVKSIPGMAENFGSVNPNSSAVTSLHGALKSFLADPSGTIAKVGDTVRNATPAQVGANVVAPLVAGGAAGEVGGLASKFVGGSTAAATEAASDAGQLGFRTTAPHPLAGHVSDAGTTLDLQHQAVAKSVLGADAGVPHDVPFNHSSLVDAAKAPGTLLDQGAAALPTVPLSQGAAAKVMAARGPNILTKPTPNVAAVMDSTEQSLLGDPNRPITGKEVRATRNSNSADANAGMNSDDPDARAIAKYKRSVVDALDQHIADTMPADSAISPDMIANARATLAKNYNLRDLIGKGGDIDLQALAKDHRENPNKFTGPTRTVAQFASDHPEVTGSISDATRIAPPSFMKDMGDINPLYHPIGSIAQALFGGAARRALRGPAGAAEGLAEQTPVAGLAGEFEPKPNPLAPPTEPPLTTSAPAGVRPPPAPYPGTISHADVLAHGVEQPLPEGLTSGPMGAPPQEGMPFVRNAAHEAGDLSLDDHFAGPRTYGGQPASELPGVMSANVPNEIMAKTAPQGPRPNVAHSPSFINQNASLGNKASLEAAARVKGGLSEGVHPVSFGADDQQHIMSPHDVERADLHPAPDSIFINAKDGSLIDSGGMAPALVRNLLARWKAIHGTPLDKSF
jgi:hypothetical protein